MHYYVDHTSRFGQNTGIQCCVRAVARALMDVGTPLRPVVWSRQQADFDAASPQALHHLARWSGPAVEGWWTDEVRRPGSAEPHPTDRWLLIVELVSGPHSPTPRQLQRAAGRRGWQVAWVFHDAIPIRLAHLYGPGGAITSAHHAAYMRGLALFPLVLANSLTTAHHLRTFLQHEGLPWGHVRPLPLALELLGTSPGKPPHQPTSHRPKRILCVGSLEPRKNHRALLKALVWLAAQDRCPAELVLVGWANDPGVVAQVNRASSLGVALQWQPQVDDQRLSELYDWCDFTVYPSLEEGFGLPVAESLWKRRPCVCSGEGALGELAAGGGCKSVNTSSWRELAAALEDLVHDSLLQHRLQVQVQQRVLRSWRQYAQDLLQNLDQAESSTVRQQAIV